MNASCFSINSQIKEQSFFNSPLTSAAYSREFWENVLSSTKKQNFFYHLVIKTIESLHSKRYTDFDAHATTNCCHGMSIFAKDLLFLANGLDLHEIQQRMQEAIDLLGNGSTNEKIFIERLPDSLIDLASLYILAYATEQDSHRGRVTRPRKLKKIAPIGTDFCSAIVRGLQRIFSNLIAGSYYQYLRELHDKMEISGAPVSMWGKYISPNYLREDKRQIRYASSMYSMQVSLAYLIRSRAKVVLTIDLMSSSDEVKGRYVRILEGDGESQLRPLDLEDMEILNPHEPVVVFGCCAYSDSLDLNSLELRMLPWLYQFPSLVQAHEIHYPQFPSVNDDPTFNSLSITPDEEHLKDVIARLSNVKGVSAEDPSFCCFTHIFPASVKQVLQVISGEDEAALPNSAWFLPAKFRASACVV